MTPLVLTRYLPIGEKGGLSFLRPWMRRRDIIVAQYDAFTPSVSEKAPTPIDKDAGLFFSAIEQGQVHTQPGEPGQVSRHGAACRQLNNCRPAPDLGHHPFVEILERLRLLAFQ